ncbi:hypothetical protein AURDEDRAFT_132162, partial [Auricularia subglabra TFB-10046 SS5]
VPNVGLHDTLEHDPDVDHDPALRSPDFTHTARTRSPTPLQGSPTPSRHQEPPVPSSPNGSETTAPAPKSNAPKSTPAKSTPAKTNAATKSTATKSTPAKSTAATKSTPANSTASKSNPAKKRRNQPKHSNDELDDENEACPLPSCVLPTNRFAFQLEPVREWSIQFMQWASKYAIDASKDRLSFGKSYMNKVSSMMSRIVKEGVWTSSIHSCKLVRPEYEAALLNAAQTGRNEARAAGITRLSPAALAEVLKVAKHIYEQGVEDGTLPVIELPKAAKQSSVDPDALPSADDTSSDASSSHRSSASTPPVTKARTRAKAAQPTCTGNTPLRAKASSSKRKPAGDADDGDADDGGEDHNDNPQSSIRKHQTKKPRLAQK